MNCKHDQRIADRPTAGNEALPHYHQLLVIEFYYKSSTTLCTTSTARAILEFYCKSSTSVCTISTARVIIEFYYKSSTTVCTTSTMRGIIEFCWKSSTARVPLYDNLLEELSRTPSASLCANEFWVLHRALYFIVTAVSGVMVPSCLEL